MVTCFSGCVGMVGKFDQAMRKEGRYGREESSGLLIGEIPDRAASEG